MVGSHKHFALGPPLGLDLLKHIMFSHLAWDELGQMDPNGLLVGIEELQELKTFRQGLFNCQNVKKIYYQN